MQAELIRKERTSGFVPNVTMHIYGHTGVAPCISTIRHPSSKTTTAPLWQLARIVRCDKAIKLGDLPVAAAKFSCEIDCHFDRRYNNTALRLTNCNYYLARVPLFLTKKMFSAALKTPLYGDACHFAEKLILRRPYNAFVLCKCDKRCKMWSFKKIRPLLASEGEEKKKKWPGREDVTQKD